MSEFRTCISRIRLYGGLRKNQRQNFFVVPPGSHGIVTSTSVTDYGTVIATVKFEVGGKLLYVRCALAALELTRDRT